jgi:hypothetical protein
MDSLRCELLHDGSHVRVTMVQMPAVNTPQFDWVKTRLPRAPQPVPPIFQPEVAAEAVLWAADHDRPELYVGASTVLAIVGNKVSPRLGDAYLARTGYRSQQTSEPIDRHRPDNLWTPVAGDHGAHGRFDTRAHSRSLQLKLTIHRGALAAALGVGAALVWWGGSDRHATRAARASSADGRSR